MSDAKCSQDLTDRANAAGCFVAVQRNEGNDRGVTYWNVP